MDHLALGLAGTSGYLKRLQALGLSVDDAKPLVFARLYAEAMAARVNDPDAYWTTDFTDSWATQERARIAIEDEVRTELINIFGSEASRDPAFRSIFKPLSSRFDFLSAAQQLALQKYQLSELAKRRELDHPPQNPPAPAQAVRGKNTAQLRAELAGHLGVEGALGYVYRFSPIGDQLRSASIGLSESEFQTAFDALMRFEVSADADSYRSTRASLRAALGAQRFGRLWATRDPYFTVIQTVGRERKLTDQMIFAAYEIFSDAQDRFADAASEHLQSNPDRANSDFRAVQEQMEGRLRGLLGDETTRSLLAAQSQFSFRIRAPSSTD